MLFRAHKLSCHVSWLSGKRVEIAQKVLDWQIDKSIRKNQFCFFRYSENRFSDPKNPKKSITVLEVFDKSHVEKVQ